MYSRIIYGARAHFILTLENIHLCMYRTSTQLLMRSANFQSINNTRMTYANPF